MRMTKHDAMEFHRLPIFWDGRLNAFGHKDVTARYALWEEEEE